MEHTGSPARVLVVEDDRKTADLVALYLRHAGHRVFVEHAGDRALDRLGRESFDLLLLDVMLPGVTGLDICRQVRATSATSVILLTARTAEDQRVEGLELGADDYVCKPFSPRELVARVNAVLRRAPRSDDVAVRWGAIVIDRAARVVTVGDRAISLTRAEFDLLDALADRAGRVRRRDELLQRISAGPEVASDRTIDVHIRNLRRKLEPQGDGTRYIETVIGVGYRLAPPDDTVGNVPVVDLR